MIKKKKDLSENRMQMIILLLFAAFLITLDCKLKK